MQERDGEDEKFGTLLSLRSFARAATARVSFALYRRQKKERARRSPDSPDSLALWNCPFLCRVPTRVPNPSFISRSPPLLGSRCIVTFVGHDFPLRRLFRRGALRNGRPVIGFGWKRAVLSEKKQALFSVCQCANESISSDQTKCFDLKENKQKIGKKS